MVDCVNAGVYDPCNIYFLFGVNTSVTDTPGFKQTGDKWPGICPTFPERG